RNLTGLPSIKERSLPFSHSTTRSMESPKTGRQLSRVNPAIKFPAASLIPTFIPPAAQEEKFKTSSLPRKVRDELTDSPPLMGAFTETKPSILKVYRRKALPGSVQ